MRLIYRFLRFCVGGCGHRHTYRERRELHGAQVLHLVCEDCGRAVPAIQRTAREHRLVIKAGAIQPTKVRRVPAELVAVGMRRSAAQLSERRRAHG